MVARSFGSGTLERRGTHMAGRDRKHPQVALQRMSPDGEPNLAQWTAAIRAARRDQIGRCFLDEREGVFCCGELPVLDGFKGNQKAAILVGFVIFLDGFKGNPKAAILVGFVGNPFAWF